MRVAVLTVALVCVAATAAASSPSQEFVNAKRKFSTGAYTEAITLISPLLYPQPRLGTDRETAEAHLLLAVAYYELGQFSSAEAEWKKALNINAELTVEPPAFSEKQARFFQERKAAYERENERLRRDAEIREKLQNMVVLERRDAWKNFVPLGLGQFQNGHTTKGIAFFAAQTLLIGANLTAYTLQGVRYGFRNGTVPPDELDTAETLQVIQIGTGVAALGLIAWGIIDAWYYYEPTISRGVDPELLELFNETNAEDGDGPPATRMRLSPTVGPDYAGAGLSLEF